MVVHRAARALELSLDFYIAAKSGGLHTFLFCLSQPQYGQTDTYARLGLYEDQDTPHIRKYVCVGTKLAL